MRRLLNLHALAERLSDHLRGNQAALQVDDAGRQPFDRPVRDDDRDEERRERADGFGARFGHARGSHQDRDPDREARGDPDERIGYSLGLRQVDRETLAPFGERAVPFEFEIGGVEALMKRMAARTSASRTEIA